MALSSKDGAAFVDFASLAWGDPDFAKIYNAHSGRIDFQHPDTVQQLTKSILKYEFNLQLELPEDRLCPPVPVRYEYIRWMQSLIDTTSANLTERFDPGRDVVGIDIGVGASCIYPLLGCASRPKWRFVGTDIDDKNFEYATKNVQLNNLQSRITLHKSQKEAALLSLSGLDMKHADFVMCNPPFFTSKEDKDATHTSKKKSPSAVCSGADVEMITEGGDLGFVLRIVEESEKLREQVQWYSSMLGKLSSATKVVAALKERGISNWAVATLQAGNVTKRWVVAWSFGDRRPRNDVARGDITIKEFLPFPTEYTFKLASASVLSAATTLTNIMSDLSLDWSTEQDGMTGLCIAKEKVWSRLARRKRKRDQGSGHDHKASSDGNANGNIPALGVRISLKDAEPETEVNLRWIQGLDSVLFESFCGMLKRELSNSTREQAASVEP